MLESDEVRAGEGAGPPLTERERRRAYLVGLARAAGGAVLFSIPILMTMELWFLGFTIDRLRLALLLLVNVPLLVGLARISGFRRDFDLEDLMLDAAGAIAVGVLMSAALLAMFNVIGPGMALGEVVGKIAVQSVPASIGAMLAGSQLAGAKAEVPHEPPGGYLGELFQMVVGALYLAFSVAPTEEMALIAYQMTPWHGLALLAASLLAMHAFVYAVEFRGQPGIGPGESQWGAFLRFTVVGYTLALLVSAYSLWTFGQLEGGGLRVVIGTVIVLGFPAALGAAAARLIL